MNLVRTALAHPDLSGVPPDPASEYDALPDQEVRRQKVLAMPARDGGQYATLVEDPNTDPVIMALAAPDGTCELQIPRDRYDPFAALVSVTKGSLDPDLLGFIPFRIQAPVIQPTSCVKSLKVRVPIGNWCNMRQGVPAVPIYGWVT